MLSPSQVIVLATPVFFALIAVEWIISARRKVHPYRLADALSSMSLGLMSQTSAVFTKLLTVGIYTAVFEHVALVRADAFWTSIPGWLIALLFYDFLYYWNHRLGHEVGVLWAAHVVHHQSQQYNLSTALRQPGSYALLSWLFYLPMALAGVPPLVFVVVGLIDLLYQFWVHTEQVRRLGWFDRWFCAPSNHRVHHAVNDPYLDRNYGGILIIWDRMFGTFKEEDDREPCVYGTRGLLKSWDPLWANASIYSQLAHDSWHTRGVADKLRVWLKPPGWRPADVAARFPKPAFVLDEHRVLFEPALSRGVTWFACIQFAALIAGAALFLWNADRAPLAHNLVWFAALTTGQWVLGACLQGRIGVWLALMIDCAALATATGALGLSDWHMVFKPAVMLLACAQVLSAQRAAPLDGAGHARPYSLRWLLVALQWSLVGDVCLMFASPAMFLPGLVSFLLAHIAYIVVLKRGMRWFADRRALVVTLALGVGMYGFLWHGGLPAELRIPVAVYVGVIALMAAQAWGRSREMQSPGALRVAVGASFFMASDTILAIDRFVQPVPHALFWVLASYFAAQTLIVHGLTAHRSP
ncbi:lysoplasmalogenase family protein [Diaphorobacter aerolatus]|uniref:Sterol desaturase family protein n=1 Tax=Diaphorobacter aerolatus TaxID=1288495 RepID=A0A7H0GP11_9BURK|nr:lysoplasmalogenase family protein [Diaphorobacter aerolatus]QNP50027.1 sterol desaturase family protein [Diaphorobacter aerolatus]